MKVYNGLACESRFFKDRGEFVKGSLVCLKDDMGKVLGIVKWEGNSQDAVGDKEGVCEYIRVFTPVDE